MDEHSIKTQLKGWQAVYRLFAATFFCFMGIVTLIGDTTFPPSSTNILGILALWAAALIFLRPLLRVKIIEAAGDHFEIRSVTGKLLDTVSDAEISSYAEYTRRVRDYRYGGNCFRYKDACDTELFFRDTSVLFSSEFISNYNEMAALLTKDKKRNTDAERQKSYFKMRRDSIMFIVFGVLILSGAAFTWYQNSQLPDTALQRSEAGIAWFLLITGLLLTAGGAYVLRKLWQ